jgi:integrase
LTEDEIGLLAGIALRHWGPDGYGPVARAWVLFGAWVGCRPGETFTVQAENLNFADGLVTVRRVKKRGGRYPLDEIVLPGAAVDAIRAMPRP